MATYPENKQILGTADPVSDVTSSVKGWLQNIYLLHNIVDYPAKREYQKATRELTLQNKKHNASNYISNKINTLIQTLHNDPYKVEMVNESWQLVGNNIPMAEVDVNIKETSLRLQNMIDTTRVDNRTEDDILEKIGSSRYNIATYVGLTIDDVKERRDELTDMRKILQEMGRDNQVPFAWTNKDNTGIVDQLNMVIKYSGGRDGVINNDRDLRFSTRQQHPQVEWNAMIQRRDALSGAYNNAQQKYNVAQGEVARLEALAFEGGEKIGDPQVGDEYAEEIRVAKLHMSRWATEMDRIDIDRDNLSRLVDEKAYDWGYEDKRFVELSDEMDRMDDLDINEEEELTKQQKREEEQLIRDRKLELQNKGQVVGTVDEVKEDDLEHGTFNVDKGYWNTSTKAWEPKHPGPLQVTTPDIDEEPEIDSGKLFDIPWYDDAEKEFFGKASDKKPTENRWENHVIQLAKDKKIVNMDNYPAMAEEAAKLDRYAQSIYIKSNQLKNLGKGMLKDIKSNKELNDRIDALQKNLNKVEKGNWTWKTIFNFYDKDSPESKWIREIWKLRGKRAKEHGSIG